jgi:hypothetical protein
VTADQLASNRQSLRQHLGETRGENLRLRGADVVGHPMHDEFLRRRIEEPECRTRISVTRLADGSAVHEVPCVEVKADGEFAGAGGAHMAQFVGESIPGRHVRMAEQTDRRSARTASRSSKMYTSSSKGAP